MAPAKDEDDEIVNFWGKLGQGGSRQPKTWRCLVLAFYDYLRATTNSGPLPMKTESAKVYLTPEMVLQWKSLMGIDDTFTEQEAEYLDIHTLDKLLVLDYNLWQLPYEMAPRNGDRGQMPYLTRAGFITLFAITVIRDPNVMIERLNAILQDPSHLIIDPRNDEPFAHLIRRASISEETEAKLRPLFPKVEEIRKAKRAEILASRRSEAIANKATRRSGARGGMWALAIMNAVAQESVAIRNDAAENTSRMAAANAMLWGQVQQGFALRNGNAAQLSALF